MEAVEIGEIASIHELFMHVAEKIAGCSKRLGEYPTLSAIFSLISAQNPAADDLRPSSMNACAHGMPTVPAF